MLILLIKTLLQGLVFFITLNGLSIYSSENITDLDYSNDNHFKVRKLFLDKKAKITKKKYHEVIKKAIRNKSKEITKFLIYFKQGDFEEQIDFTKAIGEEKDESFLKSFLTDNPPDLHKKTEIISHLAWVGDNNLGDDLHPQLDGTSYECIEFLSKIVERRRKKIHSVLKKKISPEIPEDLIGIIIDYLPDKPDELNTLKESLKNNRELQQKKKIEKWSVALRVGVEEVLIFGLGIAGLVYRIRIWIKEGFRKFLIISLKIALYGNILINILPRLICFSLTNLVIKPSFFLSNAIHEKDKPCKLASKLKKLERESKELLKNRNKIKVK